MKYVVVDLEWNQALSSKSPVFNKLPLHLRGEIIEIGAVMLNEDFSLGDEFSIDIKPVYFKKMHYKVKKITGFDAERLSHGVSFPEAYERFHEWCGDDVTFITGGCDDQNILEQNIIIHDLFWEWILYLQKVLTDASDVEMSVKIGTENDNPDMKDCSVVTVTYKAGGKNIGTMGVVGPTRMDYGKVMAVLKYLSSSLSDILGKLLK